MAKPPSTDYAKSPAPVPKGDIWVHINCNPTAELHPDGTVSTIGQDGTGRNAVWFWKDVVDIGCGETHTVGLRSDGTVLTAGGLAERGDLNTVAAWTDQYF